MNFKKIISIAAAAVMVCAALTSCENSSSASDSSNSFDTSSTASAASSESTSEASSSASQESSSAGGDSSQATVNAIGYDVNGSKRLYDNLKSSYDTSGYKVTLSHANNAGATIVINKKGNKVYSSNTSSTASTGVLYLGDKKATMFNFKGLQYQEQTVDDEAKFVAQKDLLFGMTGEFSKAQIDNSSDTIVEIYKINKDVAGEDGQIGFCFRGSDGKFIEVFVLYNGQEMAQYFAVRELVSPSEDLFKMPDINGYTKV